MRGIHVKVEIHTPSRRRRKGGKDFGSIRFSALKVLFFMSRHLPVVGHGHKGCPLIVFLSTSGSSMFLVFPNVVFS